MPLVLLDRDGVINKDSPTYVKCPAEWVPLPHSLDAIARLNRAGWRVAICTNQAGVAKGLLSRDDLDAINRIMRLHLARVGGHVDAILSCTHAPEERCACRKPEPGLLLSAMRKLATPPHQTTYIGDSLRDMQAAIAAACTPLLVRTGNGQLTEASARDLGVTLVFDDLAGAADWLLTR